MNLSKPIGGYLELETNNFGSVFHDKAIAVNSCRNALEYILLANNYKKIYIPYYTCDVTLQPIKRLNIDFEFYHLNNNFFPKIEAIEENEVLLFVNYFGLMNNSISILQEKYQNLIIDNAQAFYAKPFDTIPTIYSPRKFFGLPDGGFVYSDKKLNINLETDKSDDRMSHLITRVEAGAEEGYKLFQQNENKLDDLPLQRMSKLTDKLLRNIDFETVRKKRNENFGILHRELKNGNEFSSIIEKPNINGPLVYPFLRKGNVKLRDLFIEERIFIATYWPNVWNWCDGESLEHYLADNLLPLPIDQRYGVEDMQKILLLIQRSN